MTLASLEAKAEEVRPTRPDLILQAGSAAQIGADRQSRCRISNWRMSTRL
jgi:hypothetical protein